MCDILVAPGSNDICPNEQQAPDILYIASSYCTLLLAKNNSSIFRYEL